MAVSGKILGSLIVAIALIAGVAIYWLQIYAFYEPVTADAVEMRMTNVVTGQAEGIIADGFHGIDADSSPLRFRGCFTTTMSQALLTETYETYEQAAPLTAPRWFDCFNAVEIGKALETGEAIAFLGERDIIWGFDRVIAVFGDGRSFAWHQINDCGKEVFDGRPLPEGCPTQPPAHSNDMTPERN